MKLHVCYGTFAARGHPCGKAYEALREAGHDPEVVRTYGCFHLDPLFPGRRAVKERTGSYEVPVLELDDGTVIADSARIIAWAAEHPAGGAAA